MPPFGTDSVPEALNERLLTKDPDEIVIFLACISPSAERIDPPEMDISPERTPCPYKAESALEREKELFSVRFKDVPESAFAVTPVFLERVI